MTQREFLWIPYGLYGFHVDSMDSIWTLWTPCGLHGFRMDSMWTPWIPYGLNGFRVDSMDSYANGCLGDYMESIWTP